MESDCKIINYLSDTKEPYILQIEELNVEMIYSDNKKNFEDCIVKILKQKYKRI